MACRSTADAEFSVIVHQAAQLKAAALLDRSDQVDVAPHLMSWLKGLSQDDHANANSLLFAQGSVDESKDGTRLSPHVFDCARRAAYLECAALEMRECFASGRALFTSVGAPCPELRTIASTVFAGGHPDRSRLGRDVGPGDVVFFLGAAVETVSPVRGEAGRGGFDAVVRDASKNTAATSAGVADVFFLAASAGQATDPMQVDARNADSMPSSARRGPATEGGARMSADAPDSREALDQKIYDMIMASGDVGMSLNDIRAGCPRRHLDEAAAATSRLCESNRVLRVDTCYDVRYVRHEISSRLLMDTPGESGPRDAQKVLGAWDGGAGPAGVRHAQAVKRCMIETVMSSPGVDEEVILQSCTDHSALSRLGCKHLLDALVVDGALEKEEHQLDGGGVYVSYHALPFSLLRCV